MTDARRRFMISTELGAYGSSVSRAEFTGFMVYASIPPSMVITDPVTDEVLQSAGTP